MARPSKSRSRRFQQIIYALKQNFGIPAALYRMTSTQADLDTGRKNVTVTKYRIPKMVIISAKIKQKFEYDLAFIAANKNFTYGAQFLVGDRMFLIPKAYLPSTFELTMNDYVVVEEKRYNIVTFVDLDFGLGYYIQARRTQHEQPFATHEPTPLYDVLPLADSFGGTL